MEDKRILKTKKNIKSTLIEMLHDMQFENITVTEICRRGLVSRITFYTYYEDKYSLVNEIFEDYAKEVRSEYNRLQKLNNPENNPLTEYDNMFECAFNFYYNNPDLFALISPQKNPYLFAEFQNHIFNAAVDFFNNQSHFKLRYPAEQTASLICCGMYGVINVCNSSQMPVSDTMKLVHSMYTDILKSDLFIGDKS